MCREGWYRGHGDTMSVTGGNSPSHWDRRRRHANQSSFLRRRVLKGLPLNDPRWFCVLRTKWRLCRRREFIEFCAWGKGGSWDNYYENRIVVWIKLTRKTAPVSGGCWALLRRSWVVSGWLAVSSDCCSADTSRDCDEAPADDHEAAGHHRVAASFLTALCNAIAHGWMALKDDVLWTKESRRKLRHEINFK